jgi:hypothetical protein
MSGSCRTPTLNGVPWDVQPDELARLLDYAERPRVDDWSLRAALTRYAQPQPQRVSDVLDHVRRIEFALGSYRKTIESEGPDLWQAVKTSDDTAGDRLVGMLRAMVELDRLGDVLATWAADPSSHERPDDPVDLAVADVGRRLDALGIPREERPPPTARGRGRG